MGRSGPTSCRSADTDAIRARGLIQRAGSVSCHVWAGNLPCRQVVIYRSLSIYISTTYVRTKGGAINLSLVWARYLRGRKGGPPWTKFLPTPEAGYGRKRSSVFWDCGIDAEAAYVSARSIFGTGRSNKSWRWVFHDRTAHMTLSPNAHLTPNTAVLYAIGMFPYEQRIRPLSANHHKLARRDGQPSRRVPGWGKYSWHGMKGSWEARWM